MTILQNKEEHNSLTLDKERAGAGAFGGSRQAIAEGEIIGNVLDQQARTGSQLRSQGFQQDNKLAQQAANQQLRQAQLNWTVGCISSWTRTTRTTNGNSRY